jgi:hypothetical protein
MAGDALRYLADIDEARKLQTNPLTEATDTRVTEACRTAEDLIDQELGKRSIATPITITNLDKSQQDLLKLATARMVAVVLFEQDGPQAQADKAYTRAMKTLNDFITHADLDHTTVQSRAGIVNYQEEFVNDWNEVNETIENMDE